MNPLILDLFCGAGGASKGYHEAGFNVVGVDISRQPRYPYGFLQHDALMLLQNLIDGEWYYIPGYGAIRLANISAIHASPPCQHYSKMSNCRPGLKDNYPDLIEPTRKLLMKSGLPYIIENVEGAPLIDPITLCGSQFNCTSYMPKIGPVGLQRHRLFESSFPLTNAGPHDHSLPPVQVVGHGAAKHHRAKGIGESKAAREVMGIHWMRRDELNEAIPPAYTLFVGRQLMEFLND